MNSFRGSSRILKGMTPGILLRNSAGIRNIGISSEISHGFYQRFPLVFLPKFSHWILLRISSAIFSSFRDTFKDASQNFFRDYRQESSRVLSGNPPSIYTLGLRDSTINTFKNGSRGFAGIKNC